MGHVRHVHYHENHDTNGIWNLSCKGPGQSDCMIWHVGEGRRREALFRIRETVFVFLCCCSAMNLEQGDQARSLLRSGGKRHPYWHFIAPSKARTAKSQRLTFILGMVGMVGMAHFGKRPSATDRWSVDVTNDNITFDHPRASTKIPPARFGAGSSQVKHLRRGILAAW